MQQALRIFELPKLVRDADQDIRIRADADAAAIRKELAGWKRAVAQIGFRDRAKPGDRPRLRHRDSLGFRHMGRVNEAPPVIDGRIGKQPLDRARARPGDTVVHFARLLGGVDMNRS